MKIFVFLALIVTAFCSCKASKSENFSDTKDFGVEPGGDKGPCLETSTKVSFVKPFSYC
ncbi:MAG: hypothetical protein NTV34_09645 [Proteobacteria bacterium]|nr:hypothetical protein [Pseudomonadota bacterium]